MITDRQKLIKHFAQLVAYSTHQIGVVNERDLNTDGTLCSGQIKGLKSSISYFEAELKAIKEIASSYK